MRAARRVLASGLAAATLLGLVAAPPAAADPARTGAPAVTVRTTDLDPGVYPITLLTGDQVRLTVAPDRSVQVNLTAADRADGSTPSLNWLRTSDGIFVLPADVREHVEAGRLDAKLFDIEYLAANGLTDQQAPTLPLIVEYVDGVGARQAGIAATAAETTPLSSIDASAVEVDRTRVGDFWAAVRRNWPDGTTGARARAGIERVWLDRPAQLALDVSVPQIGAPAAWQAGLDGKGVRLAVLDSGVDATHPDLAGRVAASRNFVDDGPAVDGHGHGTHVTTTIIGSGAASGGRFKGVAPGAEVMVGRVCDDSGQCSTSSVIAGMEWAARDQRARVINMSVGGCCGDGTDPMSQSLQQLSVETGALFVVAAGNEGGRSTIHSPGSADAALTVGAVDKSGQLASFSSQGPRPGDSALKPEISAPGVDIVAGRAKGTSMSYPVDEFYTRANGTSMATPHVTGAAVLLAQRHPDWTGQQLKAALIAGATDLGHSVYAQGSGRVDIARAITNSVQVDPPVADFRFLPEPKEGDPPVTRTLTYDNPTTAPVTLTLDGTGLPLGLSADTLTVPAGGTASVTVSLDPTALGAGPHGGAVTATAGEQRLRIPVAVVIGDQQHRITFRLTDRDCDNGVHCTGSFSSFAFSSLQLIPYDGATQSLSPTGLPTTVAVPRDHRSTQDEPDQIIEAFMPPGRYLVRADAFWIDGDTNRMQSAEFVLPQVEVDGPTTLDFDANRAVKARHLPPRPVGDGLAGSSGWTRSVTTGGFPIGGGSVNSFGYANYWSYPSKAVTDGTFFVTHTDVLEQPQVAMTLTGRDPVALSSIYEGYRPPTNGHWTVPVRFPDGTRTLPVVDVGDGLDADYEGRNVAGKLVLVRKIGDPTECDIKVDQLRRAVQARAAGVLYNLVNCSGPAAVTGHPAYQDKPRIPFVSVSRKDGEVIAERLRSGPVGVRMTTRAVSPYTYFVKSYRDDGIGESLDYRYPDNEVMTVKASYHARQDKWSRHFWNVRRPDEPFLLNQAVEFPTPISRTEYIAAVDPEVTHERIVVPGAEVGGIHTVGRADVVRLDRWRKPGRLTERWNAEPMVPGAYLGLRKALPEHCAGCREGDRLWPMATVTGGDPVAHGLWVGETLPTRPDLEHSWDGLALYRNGKPVPLEDFDGYGMMPSFVVPPEESHYRLVMDLSTTDKSHTEWEYRSGAQTGNQLATEDYNCRRWFDTDLPCRAEPLIFLRYNGMDTDAYQRVDGRGPHRFEVTTYRQPTKSRQPAIVGLRVWASDDGGRHWQQARTRATGGGRYSVQVDHRSAHHRTSDSVTLRVEAWDASGNSVRQTVPDAYRLTGRR